MNQKLCFQIAKFFLLFLSVVLLNIPVHAAEKKPKERLAVLDLEATHGIEKSFAEALSVIVRDKLHSFGDYQVMSKGDIQAVASREQLKQALGCDDDGGSQCLVDFGRAIGTRFMVAGDISKLGSTYTVSLRMLDTKSESAGVTNRVSESCKCDDDALIGTVQDVAAKLVGKPTSAATKKMEEEKKLAEEKKRMEEAEQKRITAEQKKIDAEKQRVADAKVKQGSTAVITTPQSHPEDPDELALSKAMTTYLEISKQGIEELNKQARGGNLFSAMILERSYRKGLGGALKDEIAAKQWLEAAQKATASLERLAGKGDVIALSWLGNKCRDSEISDEHKKAYQYFEKAADFRYTYAMNALGELYEAGKGGLTKDEVKAVEWFKKAADNNNFQGMKNLGNMYRAGKGGLAQDEVKAVELFKKAADNGNAHGMSNLGLMYETGKGGLVKDEARAVEWYKKATDNNNFQGMNSLGYMYRTGKGGLVKDEVRAVELFKKAADNGNADGMSSLGWMYETGKGGLVKDEARAVEWYKKAAKVGNEFAVKRLKEMGHE